MTVTSKSLLPIPAPAVTRGRGNTVAAENRRPEKTGLNAGSKNIPSKNVSLKNVSSKNISPNNAENNPAQKSANSSGTPFKDHLARESGKQDAVASNGSVNTAASQDAVASNGPANTPKQNKGAANLESGNGQKNAREKTGKLTLPAGTPQVVAGNIIIRNQTENNIQESSDRAGQGKNTAQTAGRGGPKPESADYNLQNFRLGQAARPEKNQPALRGKIPSGTKISGQILPEKTSEANTANLKTANLAKTAQTDVSAITRKQSSLSAKKPLTAAGTPANIQNITGADLTEKPAAGTVVEKTGSSVKAVADPTLAANTGTRSKAELAPGGENNPPSRSGTAARTPVVSGLKPDAASGKTDPGGKSDPGGKIDSGGKTDPGGKIDSGEKSNSGGKTDPGNRRPEQAPPSLPQQAALQQAATLQQAVIAPVAAQNILEKGKINKGNTSTAAINSPGILLKDAAGNPAKDRIDIRDRKDPRAKTKKAGLAKGRDGALTATSDKNFAEALNDKPTAAGKPLPQSVPAAVTLKAGPIAAGADGKNTGPLPLQTGLLALQEVSPNNIKNLASGQPAATPPAANQANVTPQTVTRQINLAITQQAGDGINSFKISLKPADLGQVDIKMDIQKDGKITATITVDSQRTLNLLHRDQASLQKALTNSGFDAGGNNLNFSLRQQPNSSGYSYDNNNGDNDGGDSENDPMPSLLHNIITQQQMKMTYSDNILDINI